mmetsp:Transcript_19544/g.39584  ORF Transcript_19544/g.39584 Transcript_19544/m.39584 type:complete len:581 (-) Transcript_19544:136-1878(-)
MLKSMIARRILRKKEKTCSGEPLKTQKEIDLLLDRVAKNDPGLKVLSLECQMLGERGAKALVSALSENYHVSELRVRHNGFGPNGSRLVSRLLCSNSTIRKVDLCHNKIGNEGLGFIMDALTKNQVVEYVDLRQNEIDDKGAQTAVAALESTSPLATFDLRLNNISDGSKKSIDKALKKNCVEHQIQKLRNNDQSLTGLRVSFGDIPFENEARLAEAIGANETLKVIYLDLTAGDLGPGRISKLMSSSLSRNRSLRVVHFSQRGRFSRRGPEGYTQENIVALSLMLEKSTTIKEVYITGDPIGCCGAEALAHMLIHNNSISQLDLRANEINDEGAMALARSLHPNNSLSKLVLSDNKIGPAGAQAFAKVLSFNNTLSEIDLSWNNIQAEGATAIFNALEKDPATNDIGEEGTNTGNTPISSSQLQVDKIMKSNSFSEPHLLSDKIKDESVVACMKSLRCDSALTKLILCNNNIGPSGAKAFAKLLSRNTTLSEIDLSCNNIKDIGAVAIFSALEKNSTVSSLCLSRNGISEESANIIMDFLSRKTAIKFIDLAGNHIFDIRALENLMGDVRVRTGYLEID